MPNYLYVAGETDHEEQLTPMAFDTNVDFQSSLEPRLICHSGLWENNEKEVGYGGVEKHEGLVLGGPQVNNDHYLYY